MPSGKAHAAVTVGTAVTIGPMLALMGGQSLAHAAAFMLGCLLGLVVNPDLDVDRGSRSHYFVRQSAGCLGATAWKLFWWPYSRLMPHRSPLSHLPVLSTALRLVYLLALPALLYWLAGQFYPLPPLSYPAPSLFFRWAVVGLMMVDTLHALLDWA